MPHPDDDFVLLDDPLGSDASGSQQDAEQDAGLASGEEDAMPRAQALALPEGVSTISESASDKVSLAVPENGASPEETKKAVSDNDAPANSSDGGAASQADGDKVDTPDGGVGGTTMEPVSVVGAKNVDPCIGPRAARDSTLPFEWTDSERHMHDIRYAEKSSPSVPERPVRTNFRLLVCGQAETGKSTTIRNLFASFAAGKDWQPTDIPGASLRDFVERPEAFTSRIEGLADAGNRLNLTYIIEEAPALEGDSETCSAALCGHIRRGWAAKQAQEADSRVPRERIAEPCVDAVLYFLPTNARIAPFDLAIMHALSALVPVLPVMCKADCLTDAEVEERKAEMAGLIDKGLAVFQFPAATLAGLADDANEQPPQLRLPFTVTVGCQTDESVGKFWFVRKYRWGMCEAYRSRDSDLKVLRQLLLEQGFWDLKEAADAQFRRNAASAPAATPAPAASIPHETSGSQTEPVVTGTPVSVKPAPAPASAPAAGSDPLLASEESSSTSTCFSPPPVPAIQVLKPAAAAPEGRAGAEPPSELQFVASEYFPVTVQDVVRMPGAAAASFRLTLRVDGQDKALCMRVGASEGCSLLSATRSTTASRPCTYDTWQRMMRMNGVHVVRTFITRCADTVFYSRIESVNAAGERSEVDARPSDAINIALRFGAPVFVHAAVVRQFARRNRRHRG